MICTKPIREFNIKYLLYNLRDLGYEVWQLEVWDETHKKAIMQFQKDNLLPIGQMDAGTLHQLGVADFDIEMERLFPDEF